MHNPHTLYTQNNRTLQNPNRLTSVDRFIQSPHQFTHTDWLSSRFLCHFRLICGLVLAALITMSALLLGGCGSAQKPSALSVFSVLGADAEAFAASWEESNVAQVVWIRNYESSETVTLSTGAPEIPELFRALSDLQVGESTDETTSDAEDIITVTMKDGSSLTLTFNNGNLVSGNNTYQTSGKKALYALSKTLFSENPDSVK